MTEALDPLLMVGLAIIACLAVWARLRQRHRGQTNMLLALHKRQMGVAVERLAAARKRAESLQQEIVLLKRELVQQQARRLRVAAQRPAATETSMARVQRGAPASEDRAEDASGFAHTQPYEREPS